MTVEFDYDSCIRIFYERSKPESPNFNKNTEPEPKIQYSYEKNVYLHNRNANYTNHATVNFIINHTLLSSLKQFNVPIVF